MADPIRNEMDSFLENIKRFVTFVFFPPREIDKRPRLKTARAVKQPDTCREAMPWGRRALIRLQKEANARISSHSSGNLQVAKGASRVDARR
jgi:hypothetical protein